MFVSMTAAVSLCLYWSSKSILMAVRTALRGAQRLPFPLFSASTSSFFLFLSYLTARRRTFCPHYSESARFLHLTNCNEASQAFNERSRKKKNAFRSPQNLWRWSPIEHDQREKIRCQSVTFTVDTGSPAWLWGWICPSFAHFKPCLLFLISPEDEGDYIFTPTPKTPTL